MTIKVFIRRSCPPGEEAALFECLLPLRQLAPQQPGYISGEYLRSLDEPGQYLTISTWMSENDWRRWFESEARQQIQAHLEESYGITTDYRLYQYCSTV